MKNIAVAPMMDWTDRHCRYFHRLIAPHVRLYTEMVTTGALLHGDRDRFLRFDESEKPLALQLGGNGPTALAACAKMGEDYGYDEINLNCGCPSDRVQNGAFGACLMKEPQTVARCVAAMSAAVKIPVTVKCRIGVDDCDELFFLNSFIEEVSKAGCEVFIIHARKALLHGLSPKENREIPPLRYDVAAAIKQRHPHLRIILNGGIKSVEDIQAHIGTVPLTRRTCGATPSPHGGEGWGEGGANAPFDGAMIGREAYQNPWFLAEIERVFFNNDDMPSREEIARMMISYIKKQKQHFDIPVKSIVRHMLGLYNGLPGARGWRRFLSEHAHRDDITVEDLIENAIPQNARKPVSATQWGNHLETE